MTPDAFTSPSDAGPDTLVPAYEASAYKQLDWYYLTTAPGESIRVSGDCGITASYEPMTGVGAVPEPECVDFKAFAVSAPMIAALSDKSPCKKPAPDSTGSANLELVDGAVYSGGFTFCVPGAEFSELAARLHTLRGKYAPLKFPDASADGD